MITLYAYGRAYGLPDASPFVGKTELILRMAGLDYRTDTAGYRRAPKGKLPYIDDDGTVVADSTFIRMHLESKYAIDFDAGLSPAERGIAWSVEKMLEDHLYWFVVDSRWMDDANFAKGPSVLFQNIPRPVRSLIEKIVRRKVASSLHAQGTGRHSAAEKLALAERAVSALAAILGDKPYLMGERPCGADATATIFLSGLLCPLFAGPLRDIAASHANILSYADRMMSRYFPELSEANQRAA